MTLARAILLISLLALGSAGCSKDAVNDAYAQWSVGEMIVAYLREHDDAWPRSWEDLRPYIARGNTRVGWSLEKFQQRIAIDFKADTKALMTKAAAAPDNARPFNVVRPRHWLGMTWSHEDPNVIIARYLKQRARAAQVEAPATQTATHPG